MGLKKSIYNDRIAVLLNEFRMEKRLKWFPAHFSKGMKQKVMIMCAFLVQPSLYIVDEPFVGLDPLGIQSLLDLMKKMKENGAGILMSTHILATAERYCDRFIILHEGKVRAQGTLEQLRKEFAMPEATLDDLYIQLTKEERLCLMKSCCGRNDSAGQAKNFPVIFVTFLMVILSLYLYF